MSEKRVENALPKLPVLKTSPVILSDEELRVLLRMYWVSDIAKVTGLPSAALRCFVSGYTLTMKVANSRKLSDFIWTHHCLMCEAFGIDSENISVVNLVKRAHNGITVSDELANGMYDARSMKNGTIIVNKMRVAKRIAK